MAPAQLSATIPSDQNAAAQVRMHARAMTAPYAAHDPMEAQIMRMQPGTRYCNMQVGGATTPPTNAARSYAGRTNSNVYVAVSPILVCN